MCVACRVNVGACVCEPKPEGRNTARRSKTQSDMFRIADLHLACTSYFTVHSGTGSSSSARVGGAGIRA